jgi:hypothetical protein
MSHDVKRVLDLNRMYYQKISTELILIPSTDSK